MVKSVVKSCLPEFSDFTRVFSPVKVLCNGPLVYNSQFTKHKHKFYLSTSDLRDMPTLHTILYCSHQGGWIPWHFGSSLLNHANIYASNIWTLFDLIWNGIHHWIRWQSMRLNQNWRYDTIKLTIIPNMTFIWYWQNKGTQKECICTSSIATTSSGCQDSGTDVLMSAVGTPGWSLTYQPGADQSGLTCDKLPILNWNFIFCLRYL